MDVLLSLGIVEGFSWWIVASGVQESFIWLTFGCLGLCANDRRVSFHTPFTCTLVYSNCKYLDKCRGVGAY
jgi:hypothetical protein